MTHWHTRFDLCPSVSSVVPVFTLARTNTSIEAAELSGMAARRMRPDRVSRYFARFRLGFAWLVPRSITSTEKAPHPDPLPAHAGRGSRSVKPSPRVSGEREGPASAGG